MKPLAEAFGHDPLYALLVVFLATYPFGCAVLAIAGALSFRSSSDPRRWYHPTEADLEAARERHPVVSVVIPAHDEEQVIAASIEGALGMRWPEIDVVVADDGSRDGTREAVMPFVRDGRARLLHKPVNEGKSMAINDALALCRSDLVLILDADGVPDPAALEHMVTRMDAGPAVAAVTGNPRVVNTRTSLARVQAIEFSATVGVQRRGDSIWGRLMTFSGLCTLLDRQAVLDLGGFAPDMATEDIDMTWRLQLAGREVLYEPAALFGMQAPERLGLWWKQRRRWARGLVQVLRRHAWRALAPRRWRLWPLLMQSSLSIVWAHVFVITAVIWAASDPLGAPPPKVAGFLGLFGCIVLITGLVQVGVGMLLDRRVDPALVRQWPWSVLYPLGYWLLCVVVVVRTTIPALLRRPRLSVWTIPREDADPATAPGPAAS